MSLKRTKLAAIAVLSTLLGAFTLLSIWAAFGFRYSALSEGGQPRDILDARWNYFLEDPGAAQIVFKFVRNHRILPEAYVYGAAYVAKNSQSRPSFLDQKWSDVGFRSFFFRAFLQNAAGNLGAADFRCCCVVPLLVRTLAARESRRR